jgi:small conductance mechanosensitive channel
VDQLRAALADLANNEQLLPLALSWGGKALGALIFFVLGRWAASALSRWIKRLCGRGDLDATLGEFLSSITYIGLMALVILTALGTLGVPTTNFLAIVGAAGLAVGLALKDSLSNFAAGVMLVFFRPFKAGDFIEAGGAAGSVDSIRIFNTVIVTGDNRVITIPNSLIYADTITNFSARDTRRIDLIIGIGYSDNIGKALDIIRQLLAAEQRVLKAPEPTLLVLELGASSVDLAVRPWVNSADYWHTRSDLLKNIKQAFDDAGISIPFPQRDIHIVSQPATE